MDTDKSYFECKRCFYKCDKKSNMIKHWDKKILCDRKLESFNFKDEELKELSLVRSYIEKKSEEKNKCEGCNKNFTTERSLKRHCDKICNKAPATASTPNTSIVSIKDSTLINSTIIQNCDNINININFDDNWNTDHIDDNLKLMLLLNKSKFTTTLQNILENEVNLNVIIDNTTDSGIVYNNNSLQKMNIKDIVEKSMNKLFKHLCIFKDDLSKPAVNLENNIVNNVLNEQINIARNKLDDFNKDRNIQDTVNKYVSDIYNTKTSQTVKVCSKIINNSNDGF